MTHAVFTLHGGEKKQVVMICFIKPFFPPSNDFFFIDQTIMVIFTGGLCE